MFDYFHDGTLYAAISGIAKDTANKAGTGAQGSGPLLDSLAAAINKLSPTVSVNGVNFTVNAAKWDSAYTMLTVDSTKSGGAAINIKASDLADAVKSFLTTWTDPASGALMLSSGAAKQFNAAAVKIGNPDPSGNAK